MNSIDVWNQIYDVLELYKDEIPKQEDAKKETFYIEYSKSKHMSSPLCEYQNDGIQDMKKMFASLWRTKNDTLYRELQHQLLLLASVLEREDTEYDEVREIELHNYTL